MLSVSEMVQTSYLCPIFKLLFFLFADFLLKRTGDKRSLYHVCPNTTCGASIKVWIQEHIKMIMGIKRFVCVKHLPQALGGTCHVFNANVGEKNEFNYF